MSRRMWATLAVTTICLALPIGALASGITFSTFVSSGSISAVEGQNQTIAFTYAGNKFVGSVYSGINNNQLYSTDLTGGSVAKFSTPIPGAGGEVVVGASLGQGGFAAGDIFAGSGANGQIYHMTNSGGAPVLFTTVPSGVVRQILFDPGSSFGGDMLVTTTSGAIYRVNSLGIPTLVANVGADTEGMDIATSAWGPYAGWLLVASEGSGSVKLVSPGGTIVTVANGLNTPETVSFVPLNLGSSGNPIEGFYVANFPLNIQFAGASQWAGLQGDAIVTEELGSNSVLFDFHYNGSGFTQTQIGTLPNQSEDGIFVTAQRIQETNTPEPASLVLFGSGLAALSGMIRKRRKN